jgi:hypothetical protein
MINPMEKVLKHLNLDLIIKVSLNLEKKMDLENIFHLLEVTIKVNLSLGFFMEKVNIYGRIKGHMLDIG